MRIGEVADITGLSISNIRFYEKKGLIAPDRQVESKYRTYTEEDLYKLKKIILYRKMDLSIETIQDIIDNVDESKLENAINNQINALKEQKDTIQSSIELCEMLLDEDNVSEIDVDYYLDYVKEEEKTGTKYPKLEELLDDVTNMTFMFATEMPLFMVSWLYNDKWKKLRHIVTFIILLIWLSYPIIIIGEELIKSGVVTGMKLFSAIIWYGIFLMYIVQYRHAKSKSS